MKISKSKTAVAVATAAATIAAGGLAYAYWSTNGTGSASAAAGNALGVTAVASPTSSGTLYPNGSVSASIQIANPNTFPVKISRVQITSAVSPTVTGGSGCTAANSVVSLGTADTGTLATPVSISANGGTASVPVGTITMGLASDNGCQGASFSFSGASIVVTAAAG